MDGRLAETEYARNLRLRFLFKEQHFDDLPLPFCKFCVNYLDKPLKKFLEQILKIVAYTLSAH